MLIKKYEIGDDHTITKEYQHVKKCEKNDQIYFGYKDRKFFDGSREAKSFALEKANKAVRRITDLIDIKTQCNLLSGLLT